MAIEKLNKTYVNNQTKLNATDFQQNVDKIDEVVTAVNNISSWEWIGTVTANETEIIQLSGRMWLLALYNEFGNFGFYILNKAVAGDNQNIRIETIKASSLITITAEGTSSIKVVAGQIACPMYLMKIN